MCGRSAAGRNELLLSASKSAAAAVASLAAYSAGARRRMIRYFSYGVTSGWTSSPCSLASASAPLPALSRSWASLNELANSLLTAVPEAASSGADALAAKAVDRTAPFRPAAKVSASKAREVLALMSVPGNAAPNEERVRGHARAAPHAQMNKPALSSKRGRARQGGFGVEESPRKPGLARGANAGRSRARRLRGARKWRLRLSRTGAS